jgi:hypothetical protein
MRFATVLLALSAAASADTIVCRDGRKIEGRILEETDEYVKLAVKHGAVTVKRGQIEKIERGATTVEVYEAKRARIVAGELGTHLHAWQATLDLAKWCAEHKLEKEARIEYGRAVELNPDCEEARIALKHVKVDGAWMTFEDACRLRGLVEFDGVWMTPEEAKLKAALKEQEAIEKEIREKVRELLRKLAAPAMETRDEARAALEQIPAEYMFAPLMEHVEHKSAEVRSYCVGALSKYPRPEVMPKVARRVLVDESEAIRAAALEALKVLAHPDTWIHLQRGLASEYAHVRMRSANALADFPNERAAEALLNSLTRLMAPRGGTSIESRTTDPRLLGDPNLSPEARKALKEGGGLGLAEDPAEKAKKEQAEKEKKAVIRALESCTGLAYGDNVDEWRNWWLQKHAATAAKGGAGDSKEETGDGVKDPRPEKK